MATIGSTSEKRLRPVVIWSSRSGQRRLRRQLHQTRQKSRNLQNCNPCVVPLSGWKRRRHSPRFPDLVPVLLANATRVARALPASANRKLCICGLNFCRSGSFCAKLNAQ
jgi:hypothetical protein